MADASTTDVMLSELLEPVETVRGSLYFGQNMPSGYAVFSGTVGP
jgi:hypothetical protein